MQILEGLKPIIVDPRSIQLREEEINDRERAQIISTLNTWCASLQEVQTGLGDSEYSTFIATYLEARGLKNITIGEVLDGETVVSISNYGLSATSEFKPNLPNVELLTRRGQNPENSHFVDFTTGLESVTLIWPNRHERYDSYPNKNTSYQNYSQKIISAIKGGKAYYQLEKTREREREVTYPESGMFVFRIT